MVHPANTEAAPIALAGHWLDLRAGTLCDARGTLVSIRPQAWSLLELLARHAGQVVSREQILQAVWPGLVVTDGSIAQAVKDLRAALGVHGRSVVQTVARRGYRLVLADVGTPAAASDVQAPLAPLPPPPERLFGRDGELAELGPLIEQHRLVTVVGTGGIGKTAFALAAAHRHVGQDLRQVAWIDLSAMDDPALLPGALARSLGLPISQGDDPTRGLLAALRPVAVLVILDNAEHLVDAVAGLAGAALAASPGLRLLVTSQAPLRLERERLFRLSALGMPAERDSLDAAARAPAVAMFVDRAQAADHRFALSEANLAHVVRLCRRLDGLPLALRLAAGRVHLLGLSGLQTHLDDGLHRLAGETRDAPPRQQTLAAALDWSYGLLSVEQQQLYRRLGVFVGGFSMALAVALCGRNDAAFEELVARSMVSVDTADSPRGPRCRLLESQREQALRELASAGELSAMRGRHAQVMGDAMRSAADTFWSTPDEQWMATWVPELDNVRTALKWSAQHDVTLCASLIGSSASMFRLLDLSAELRRQAAALGDIDSADHDVAARYWLARAQLESGRSGRRVYDCAEQAEHHARASGNRLWLYLALCQKSASMLAVAAHADALLVEIAGLMDSGWPARVRCQQLLAEFTVHSLQGRWQPALEAAQAGLALSIEAGAIHPRSVFANWTVVAQLCLGDTDAALRQSQVVQRHIVPGPASSMIPYFGTCARIAHKRGDLAEARRQLARMFDLCRSVEWMNFEVFGDLYLSVAMTERRTQHAARLLGFATGASERAWGMSRSSRTRDAARTALAGLMGEATLARLCAQGEQMDPESVCRVVLAGDDAQPLAME
jgi:predicted ATPase